MSSQVPGKGLRNIQVGTKVDRAAAVLPATTTTPYFTITGGLIAITSFIGIVTTATSATATNLKFNFLSTQGANFDFIADTAVASLPLATLYVMNTAGGAAATPALVASQNNEMIFSPGSIRAITSATNTGAMRWLVTYVPLDDGAALVAA